MAELLDLYDENGNLTGKRIIRGEPFEDKYYVFIVHSCIINENNEMLCQKRSLQKIGNPGMWDITASGFVTSGESIYEAIQRELKEELGIDCTMDEKNLLLVLREPGALHGFFFKKADYSLFDCSLQKEEVCDVQYFSIDAIKQMMESNRFIDYGILDLIKQCISSL